MKKSHIFKNGNSGCLLKESQGTHHCTVWRNSGFFGGSYPPLRIDPTGILRIEEENTKHGAVGFLAKDSLTDGIINF
jgi:hypothetical protein